MMKSFSQKYLILAVTSLVFIGLYTNSVFAQNDPTQTGITSDSPAPPETAANTPIGVVENAALTPEALILRQIEEELKEKYKKEIYIPPSIQSLVFTPDQQALLREARGGFNTKAPSEVESPGATIEGLQSGVSAVRSISLGGIVFFTPDNWTIWLNKKMVTTAKLPGEAIDLRVYKDYIELRWFDAQTNKIFPIRLRPNQTFNLDAQAFIPG